MGGDKSLLGRLGNAIMKGALEFHWNGLRKSLSKVYYLHNTLSESLTEPFSLFLFDDTIT